MRGGATVLNMVNAFKRKTVTKMLIEHHFMVRNRFSPNIVFVTLRFLFIPVLLLNVSFYCRPLAGVASHNNLGGVEILKLNYKFIPLAKTVNFAGGLGGGNQPLVFYHS